MTITMVEGARGQEWFAGDVEAQVEVATDRVEAQLDAHAELQLEVEVRLCGGNAAAVDVVVAGAVRPGLLLEVLLQKNK